MKIYVGGSLRDVPQDAELCHAFVAALGTAFTKEQAQLALKEELVDEIEKLR